ETQEGVNRSFERPASSAVLEAAAGSWHLEAISGSKKMPRRREIAKRDIDADPLYQSALVTKFINCVMSDGKRSTAERILYKSFDIIRAEAGDDPLKIFKKAIDNVKPSLEVK